MKISEYKTEELVKLFNDGLNAGKSGVLICKEVSLARSSVLTRLKREGYVYNKELNQYVVENEEITEVEAKPSIEKKTVKKKINKNKEEKKKVEEITIEEEEKFKGKKGESSEEIGFEEGCMDKGELVEFEVEKALSKLRESLWNKPKEKENVKNESIQEEKESIQEEQNYEVLEENEVESVEATDIGEIKDLLMKLEKRVSTLEDDGVKEKNIITIENTKETTTRSIRLYKEVNDKFNKYLKKHKEKKVIDILSLAILEYINKK